MPELALVFAFGIIVNLLVMAAFIIFWRLRLASQTFKNIAANLQKVDLYWSENLDRLMPLDLERQNYDRHAQLKSMLITGTILTFMSWMGVLFQLLLIFSERVFARSRLEMSLLSSPLARNPNLLKDDVKRIIEEMLGESPAMLP